MFVKENNKIPLFQFLKSTPSQESSSCFQPCQVDESKTLNCRSGPSSYSLRALKTIPLYSEYGSIPVSMPESRKRVKRDTYGTVNCCDDVVSSDRGPINFLPDEVLCKVCFSFNLFMFYSYKTFISKNVIYHFILNFQIFSYLPQLQLIKSCERVNRRWHFVARSPPLWNTLYFKGDDACIETVAGLIRFAPAGTLKTITVKDRWGMQFYLHSGRMLIFCLIYL